MKKLVAVLLLAILLSGCGSRAVVSTNGEGSKNSLFVYAENAQFLTLDPALAIDDEPLILANCYETLTRYNQATGNAEPLLATSWRAEQEGLRWVFQLRNDVRFHDGEPFNAKAAARAIERAMQFDTPYLALGDYIQKAEATGEYELTLSMHYLVPLDYYLSSLYHCYIVSPNALGADAARTAWFNAGGCAGTGPYMIAEYQKGESARLVAFPDYWKPQSAEGFEEVMISTDAADFERQLAQAGAAVVALGSPSSARAEFESAAVEFSSSSGAYSRSHLIMLNTEKYPSDNLDFRLALACAFPYSEAEAYCGQLALQNGLLSPGLPGSGEMPRRFETDLALAQQYKDRAGVADKTEIMLHYSSAQMPPPAYLESYRQNLESIGVSLVVEETALSLGELADRPSELTGQLTLISYFPGVPTPRYSFEALAYNDGETFSCHYMKDAELNALIEQTALSATLDTRGALAQYSEIQQLLDDNALFIYAGAQQATFIQTTNIEGISPQAMSYNGLMFYVFDARSIPAQQE